MQQITRASEMQDVARAWRQAGRRVGLVPTMGTLHEGHLSLVRRCRELCDTVVVSIYVNPTQFGVGEDFETYPRGLASDLAMCRREHVAAVFCPSDREAYAADHSTCVEESLLSRDLCGASRPGHFRGVTTIVAKLFNMVQPDVAVFGSKDYQQARVIERMARDLNFPVRVVVAPIVRESDGLAMSSRNRKLSSAQRAVATELNKALGLAEACYRSGERDAAVLRETALAHLRRYAGVELDYLEVVDAVTLQGIERITAPAVVLLAAKVGATRLIDNRTLSA